MKTDEEREYWSSESAKADVEAMIEMEHQEEEAGKPKVCFKCQRINPPEWETCLTYGVPLVNAPEVKLDWD